MATTRSWQRQGRVYSASFREPGSADILVSDLYQHCEKINLSCLKAPICGNLLQHSQETITGRKGLNPKRSSSPSQLVPAGIREYTQNWSLKVLDQGEHKIDGVDYLGLGVLFLYREFIIFAKVPEMVGTYY